MPRSAATSRRGPRALRLLAALLSFAVACAPTTQPGSVQWVPTSVIDAAAAIEDLEFVAATLLDVHPLLVEPHARAELLAALADARSKSAGDTTVFEHFANAAALVAALGDSHTRLVAADRYLPLELEWLSDALVVAYVAEEHAGAAFGDEVVAIGGAAPDTLLERVAKLIATDNEQFLRFLASDYLTRETVLRWLGLVEADASVTLTLAGADGAWRHERLEFTAARPQAPEERQAFGWEIVGDHGWFWLDACVDSPAYREAVAAFFRELSEAGVGTVVLDLRRNGGGQSAVDEALLTHLPVSEVRAYRVTARPSRQALSRFGPIAEVLQLWRNAFWDGVRAVPAPADPAHTFSGELIVAIGPNTFSAASDLATLLHDNRLALLVGEPSGGKPSSYGDTLRFTSPSGALTFAVSFKSFTRPDPGRDPAAELVPDVYLPQTLASLRAGEDPVALWLEARDR